MLAAPRRIWTVAGIGLCAACATRTPPPRAQPTVAIVRTSIEAPPPPPTAPPPPPSDFVYGRVTDENGRPLKLGHVRVLDASRKLLEVVKLAPDGHFVLTRPVIAGSVAWLEFTAVDHRQTATLIAADTHATEIDVHLGTYQAPASGEAVDLVPYMIGREMRILAMARQPDGSYAADVPTADGLLRYEIAGAVGEHRRVNGTMSDSYVYDGDGDYISVLSRKATTLHVVYDPKRRPQADLESSVAFASGNDPNAELWRVTQLRSKIDRASREYDATPVTRDAVRADLSRLREELQAMTESQDPMVRRVALVTCVATTCGDLRTIASQALAQIPPPDSVWATDECSVVTAIEAAGGAQANAAYVTDFIDHQPSEQAVGCYLYRQLAKRDPPSPDDARAIMKLLRSPRFALTRYAHDAEEFDPDRPLAPGKQLPDFHVTSIDGKSSISSIGLRGKLYLIEVWGPWCGPCVGEMPFMHAAYEKYGKQGKRRLHILSIAIDTTRDALTKFRTAPHPMPWDHALPNDAEKQAVQTIFGTAVPAYALIDEQGKLIAAQSDLRGPSLDRILERVTAPLKK